MGELVRQRMTDLSPSDRAAVSPPTVTRFIGKLGFGGYPEFQDVLRREVQARLSSPLARYEPAGAGTRPHSILDPAFQAFRQGLDATLELVSHQEFEEVAGLLADRRRVLVLGGRVSAPLARYLAAQLHLLRPGASLLDTERSTPLQHLVDAGRRDVLVAFDYRRYQRDTIQAARVAAGRGAAVVLFTDPWLSPASASARCVLVTSVSTVAPFDSLVGAMALVEALVAAVLARAGEQAQVRMRRLEGLRSDATWGEEPGP